MIYDRINLMLPTYGRAKTKLPRFINSAIEHASNYKNVCITFLLHKKDTDTINYIKQDIIPFETDIIFDEYETPNLAIFYNTLYEKTKFKDDNILVSMIGDDTIFKSNNFDIDILNEINKHDGIGLVYCDDCYIHHDRLCVNMFTTRKFVDGTGLSFMDERFPADFIDDIWMAVSKSVNAAYYLGDTKLYHDHEGRVSQDNRDKTCIRLREQASIARRNFRYIPGRISTAVGNLIKNGLYNTCKK